MLHLPVLLHEVIQFVSEIEAPLREGLDLTFGRGGHTRELLKAFADLKITAMDRDPEAIRYGQTEMVEYIEKGRLKFVPGNFHELTPPGPSAGWDFILADLGVSSPQLDDAHRGFSFYHDGPLDMRMDTTTGVTAADIVNRWTTDELVQLFKQLGEVPRPRRVAERIVHERKETPFARTSQLSQLIEKTDGWRKKGQHPATQYFLALRLEVNQELANLGLVTKRLVSQLRPGGRILFITFHSLEDRIIKYALKESMELGKRVNKKVVIASREEILSNPRSRSAKLRVFEAKGRSE